MTVKSVSHTHPCPGRIAGQGLTSMGRKYRDNADRQPHTGDVSGVPNGWSQRISGVEQHLQLTGCRAEMQPFSLIQCIPTRAANLSTVM
ncbi:hypothetical protein [Desulfosarcina ovata]|uniref:hypothetical protein n=1 Tax=Desulfosarcina ovata TaxID=83564 RepID=UPI0012D305BE|nr:hypothetical protein [Desulfosarcina ovata]